MECILAESNRGEKEIKMHPSSTEYQHYCKASLYQDIFFFLSVVNPDNTFEVLVDQEMVNSGSLLEDLE